MSIGKVGKWERMLWSASGPSFFDTWRGGSCPVGETKLSTGLPFHGKPPDIVRKLIRSHAAHDHDHVVQNVHESNPATVAWTGVRRSACLRTDVINPTWFVDLQSSPSCAN